MHDGRMNWIALVWMILGTVGLLAAQEGPPVAPPPAERPVAVPPPAVAKLSPLLAVIEPLENANQELKKLRDELKSATAEETKIELQSRIEAERERVKQLRANFRDILGGAEAAGYESPGDTAINLQGQISELIQPLMAELRDATSSPRELDALRKSLDRWSIRKSRADTVIARIDELAASHKGEEALMAELDSARRLWKGRQADAEGQIAVINSQILDREGKQKSLWETLSGVFGRFFKNRGLNLLVAFVVAVLGFVITRRSYLLIRKISPVHRGEKGNLTSRVSDILAMAVAVLVAVIGILLVFYTRGDWLLLTLSLVLLIGAAWAGKTALPPYIEQLRMLLNLGSVREGERVVHRGLPWKVAPIGFFTRFTNPSLQGGVLRIPIRDLMTMTSREPDPKEPWFPTEHDDWAILADGTYGKVITQTPEQVVFLRLGGSMKTFATTDFLAQSPEKISSGFRISCTFGIDYKHQPDATGTIPETLEETLTSRLIGKFGHEAVRSIKVEFVTAGASSLDYEILADFDGALAPKHRALQRLIQTICLDACNANGWVIPFTQITVHQAES